MPDSLYLLIAAVPLAAIVVLLYFTRDEDD
jgi:hypothetical protein